MCLLVVRLGMDRAKGRGRGGRVASQRTDLCSDVLKGGRTDQGEAYQEHILGENQRNGQLRVRSAFMRVSGANRYVPSLFCCLRMNKPLVVSIFFLRHVIVTMLYFKGLTSENHLRVAYGTSVWSFEAFCLLFFKNSKSPKPVLHLII